MNLEKINSYEFKSCILDRCKELNVDINSTAADTADIILFYIFYMYFLKYNKKIFKNNTYIKMNPSQIAITDVHVHSFKKSTELVPPTSPLGQLIDYIIIKIYNEDITTYRKLIYHFLDLLLDLQRYRHPTISISDKFITYIIEINTKKQIYLPL